MSKILKNCPFIGTFSATGQPYYIERSVLRSNPHIGLINHNVYKDHFKTASEYFYSKPKTLQHSSGGDIILPIDPKIFIDVGQRML